MSDSNRFTGTCYRCGKSVEVGAGLFHYELVPGLRWKQGQFQRNWPLTEHTDCATKFAGTNTHYLWSPSHESA